MTKNTDVISDFVKDFDYEKPKKTRHLFYENNVLYSYGYHYPLCIKLKDSRFIINNSGYSNTTSKHTGHLTREITSLSMRELEKQKKQDKTSHDNIILLGTEQIKAFIDYVKYRLNKEIQDATSHDLAMLELEKGQERTAQALTMP